MFSRKGVAAGGVVALLLGGLASPSGAEQVEKSDNVKTLGQVKYVGGSELASDGKYLFSGAINGETTRGGLAENGGVYAFDTRKGGKPKQIGFIPCRGNDNDVEAVRKGVLALGFQVNQCALGGSGVALLDTRNPKRMTILGSVTIPFNVHTIKSYPGEDIIYTLEGGLRNGQGRTGIVDASNPRKPELVAEFVGNPQGCHDLSFYIAEDKQLAFCAGLQETQIWDVSDPLAPVVIGRIHNPLMEFMHYPVASSDGTLLAIDDEAFAAHDCNSGLSPTGRVWIYDISTPELPLPVSSFAPPRGGDGTTNLGHYVGWVDSWCLSHGLDWQPGTHNLAVTWFTGGWSVLSLDDPMSPVEVAHYQAEDSAAYSILWHNGNLYTNDMHRGVEGFKIKGLK